jgi:hypothetical protein
LPGLIGLVTQQIIKPPSGGFLLNKVPTIQENSMLKYLIAAVILTQMSVSQAQTVINQSPKASVMTGLAQRVQADLGGDFYQSRDCRDARSQFQSVTPSVIVYETMNVAAAAAKKLDCGIRFSGDQVLAHAWQSFSVCRRSDSRQALHQSQTFGMSGMHPYAKWTQEFNARNKANLQVKVYQGSGATVQALLAREIDWGFIATAATAAAQSQGAIVCDFSTNPGSADFLGRYYQHSLADLRIQFVVLYNGANAAARRQRLHDQKFSDYLSKAGYVLASDAMTADQLQRFDQDFLKLQSAY